MVPTNIRCNNCGANIEIRSYRKIVLCPYCNSKLPFEGFDYRRINWQDSMYAGVKLWMDCPACRSPNMYRGYERRAWKCPDCGFILSEKERKHGALWFCDNCEAFLNIQPGFSNDGKRWTCTECGHVNSIGKDNII